MKWNDTWNSDPERINKHLKDTYICYGDTTIEANNGQIRHTQQAVDSWCSTK